MLMHNCDADLLRDVEKAKEVALFNATGCTFHFKDKMGKRAGRVTNSVEWYARAVRVLESQSFEQARTRLGKLANVNRGWANKSKKVAWWMKDARLAMLLPHLTKCPTDGYHQKVKILLTEKVRKESGASECPLGMPSADLDLERPTMAAGNPGGTGVKGRTATPS